MRLGPQARYEIASLRIPPLLFAFLLINWISYCLLKLIVSCETGCCEESPDQPRLVGMVALAHVLCLSQALAKGD